jgi:hypothetical protein
MSARSTPRRTKKAADYELTRFNALRHGALSRYTVLPWENADEYRTLLASLVAEHSPLGPTEEHLVEELAGILWRKRRLRLAENAAFRRGLMEVVSDQQAAGAALIHFKVEKEAATDRTELVNSLTRDQAMLLDATTVLRSGTVQAYEKALSNLEESMQKRWAELSASKELTLMPFNTIAPRYTPDADGLLQFLEHESNDVANRRTELESKDIIRDQLFGEALNPDLLDGLIRYEVHLDRKLERMASMLFRLKELRGVPAQ